MSIPFTQYLMPDGRRKPVDIDRPKEIEDLARNLIEAGFKFEIEVLTTGAISMTAEHGDKVISHEICRNGPDVPLTVDKLIRDASIALVEDNPFGE